MLSKPVKTFKEVFHKLIPPKKINHRGNIEGSEVLDCEDEEIPLEDFWEKGVDDGKLTEGA